MISQDAHGGIRGSDSSRSLSHVTRSGDAVPSASRRKIGSTLQAVDQTCSNRRSFPRDEIRRVEDRSRPKSFCRVRPMKWRIVMSVLAVLVVPVLTAVY